LTIVVQHEASQLPGRTLLARLEPVDADPELRASFRSALTEGVRAPASIRLM
jgi:hypothetical protein